MRRIATLALFVFCFITAGAQQAKQYSFKHFSVTNGLVSNYTYDVMQDADGYIWIASVNGLQRYDGNSFLTFSSHDDDQTTIPNIIINSMYKDVKNRLWLSFDHNHVGIFDTKKFLYKAVALPKDENPVFVGQHFIDLPTGELLLVKRGRTIFRYDEKKNAFLPADHILPYPGNWKANKIAWDTIIKKYWITCDSGLVQFDPATNHVNYRGHNMDKDPVIAAFEDQVGPDNVQVDKEGNVFFLYWKVTDPFPYIFRYNRKTKSKETFSLIKDLKGYHEIMNVLVQRNGRTWVYGMPFFAEWKRDSGGFTLINNELRYEQSLYFDHVVHSFEDRENNIWMATDNGVYVFNPDAQVFNTFTLVRPGEAPLQPPVQAIAETNNKIFVGCWGLGIYCFDKNFNPVPVPTAFSKHKYSYMSVWDMAINKKNNTLWIGEQGGTLDVYDIKKNTLTELQPDIFQHSTIRQIDEDTSGNIWFGTNHGRLIKWDFKKSGGDPAKGYELIFETGTITKVHYDYQGFIWVGVMGRGLFKFDAKTGRLIKVFTKNGREGERLYTDSPTDMSYYNDSTLLVTAGCLNIINTKTNAIRFFSTRDGLPSNTAQSVQKDNTGIVWMGLTNGICRLNFEKKVVSYFDRRDGIIYDKFNTTGVDHLSDGRIVFFTEHNFMVFDPKDFGQKNIPPRPYITSFKLSEQLLSLDSLWSEKRVALPYDKTSVTIGFSTLSYLQQRKIHYFYMLEGVDKDWIHVDRPMEAIYNSLPPGDYVFKVKSENADGMTSDEIASIPIFVRPPFWKTWWFLSLIGLLFILILYLIDRERVKRRESLAMVRRQIRANLKEEVSATLNNINVLSEIAKIKADKNLVQAKEFIDQISEKSRYMDEVLEDTLWSIDPANDSMKKFILRVRELTEALKTLHGVEIDLIVDNKVRSMELDMKLRYELLFFYKEAMSFIIQAINCDQLFVNINKTKSKLYIEILSECSNDDQHFVAKFENAVSKRVKALPATLDILSDSKSFSAVLYVNLG